ncbi:MAG: hypothetical protein CYPHOPRED_001013 [Cyphobasidiales sp. Tagirdzhanova-0007]|nr:MAG: hypothetical protein CYPHOPRED_001013 [Cyphobasidiales sp. Tagirdzhanova-0007]
MAFWRTKQRTPSELIRALRDNIGKLDAGNVGNEARRKATEDISKTLTQVKTVLNGDGESDPQPELVAQLAQEVYSNDMLQLVVANMYRYEFEARKDVAHICNNLLRRQIGSRLPTVEYLSSKTEVVFTALSGYDNPDIALNTGMILHEMLRHETLAKTLLYSERLYDFELLTRHKPMVAEFLDKNYDEFFSNYAVLVSSDNYVTKRQSLKLLGEILLDRTNFSIMTRYISSEENLKTMMNLLRDKSKNIQFEAFHVFKVFVANPRKPPHIESILRRNKTKLVMFLQDFHNDREDDQFNDEKQFLLGQIQAL